MECVGSLVRPGLVCGASSRRFRASAVQCLEAVKLVFGPGQLWGKIVCKWSDGVSRGRVAHGKRNSCACASGLRVASKAGLGARGQVPSASASKLQAARHDV